MQPELVGRLETALASAQKYPNSYILVTGGVKKNGWTEGDRMHDWLVEHGVADNRILVENKSANTAQNAEFSFDILYNHPTIKSISMITSQYHLKRGTILYYAESLIRARELGKTPIKLMVMQDGTGKIKLVKHYHKKLAVYHKLLEFLFLMVKNYQNLN